MVRMLSIGPSSPKQSAGQSSPKRIAPAWNRRPITGIETDGLPPDTIGRDGGVGMRATIRPTAKMPRQASVPIASVDQPPVTPMRPERRGRKWPDAPPSAWKSAIHVSQIASLGTQGEHSIYRESYADLPQSLP